LSLLAHQFALRQPQLSKESPSGFDCQLCRNQSKLREAPESEYKAKK
jgi:hypothetical protein